jgi:hypothetical protein
MLNLKCYKLKNLLFLLIFFTLGCQNTATTGFLITRGIVVNYCKEEITDIKIIHLPTNAVASFSGILSGTTAEIGFPEKELLAFEAIVIWNEGDTSYQKKLQLPQKSPFKTVAPQRLVYSIFTGGIVKAELVTDF